MRKMCLDWEVTEVCSCYENSLRCVLMCMWLMHRLSYMQVTFVIKNKIYEGVKLFPVPVFLMAEGANYFSVAKK